MHVLWSRADELTWAPFGSAMVADVEAGVDAAGNVASWSYDVFSQGHTARPGYAGAPGLLAAAHLAEPHPLPPAVDPPPASGAGSARNAVPVVCLSLTAPCAGIACCAHHCARRRCGRSARS